MRTKNLSAPRRPSGVSTCGVICLAVLPWLSSCQTTKTEKTSVSMPTEDMSKSILDSRLSSLQKEVEEYPKRHELHYRIASVLYQKNDLKQCVNALHKAIDLSPKVAKYHYHLGRVYLHMGELQSAEKEFRTACRYMVSGRYTGPHAALGYTLARQNRVDEAIEQFETCLEIEPENPSFYYFLGSLYDIKGDEESVIRYYQEYLARGGATYRKNVLFVLEKLGVEVDTQPEALISDEESLFESEPVGLPVDSGTD